MAKHSGFTFMLWLMVFSAQAQLATYELTTDGNAGFTASGVQAGPLVSGPGVQYTQANPGIGFSDNGATLKYWSENGLDSADYFEVWVAPEAGYTLTLTALRFGERRSNTGIGHYQVHAARDSSFTAPTLLADVAVPDNDEERTGDLDGLSLSVPEGDTLFIRWYGYQAESSSFGSWRINANTLAFEGIACPVNPPVGLSQLPLPGQMVQQGSNAFPAYAWHVETTCGPAHWTDAAFSITGTATAADIDGVSLWVSQDSLPDASDQQIAAQAYPGAGEISFSGLNHTFPAGAGSYVFLMVDVAPTATTGHTLQLTAPAFADFVFSPPAQEQPPASFGNGQLIEIIPPLAAGSDIVVNPGFTPTSDIPYIQHREDTLQGSSFSLGSFLLRDGGETADTDTASTRLEHLAIRLTGAQWLKRVALYSGNTEYAGAASADTVQWGNLGLLAPDNSTRELTLKVSFQDSVLDGAPVHAEIIHAEAASTGSAFSQPDAGGAQTDTTGAANHIRVQAGRLVFLADSLPQWTGTSQAFPVCVQAQDSLGNAGLQSTGNITLSLATGTGTLSSEGPLEQPLENGKAYWPAVRYNQEGPFRLQAAYTGWQSGLSPEIMAMEAFVQEGFEDGDFTFSPAWTGTSGYFTVENGQLRSQGPQADTNRIYLAALSRKLPAQEWRFTVHLDFNPTSKNFFRFYPEASQPALDGALDGYYLHIGETTADTIRFFRQGAGGTHTQLWAGNYAYNDEIHLKIRITRTISGEWQIYTAQPHESEYRAEGGSFTDNTLPTGRFIGVYGEYQTASRHDQFAWDDFFQTRITDHNASVSILQNGTDTLSSLWATPEQAAEVFAVGLADNTLHDTLPIIIDSLVLVPAPHNSFTDWTQVLGGMAMQPAAAGGRTEARLSPQAVHFVPQEPLTVPSGGTGTLHFSLFLADTSTSIWDGKQLGFRLHTRHIHTAFPGSGFAPDSVQTHPDSLQIAVEATTLRIRLLDDTLQRYKPFGVEVALTDSLGHTDTGAEMPVSLALQEGYGSLGGTLTHPAAQGKAVFDSLSYTGMSPFVLQASAGDLGPAPSGTLQISGDTTSAVLPAQNPLPADTVLSVADTRGEAVPVFRFRLADAATGDSLPTEIRSLRIANAQQEARVDWSKTIEGISFFYEDEELIPGALDIEDDYMDMGFAPGQLVVPDGDTLSLNMALFVEADDDLQDSTFFRFTIRPSRTGWGYAQQSSLLGSFPDTIQSAPFLFDVRASGLAFGETPAHTGVDEEFALSLLAVDENGNTDRGLSDSLSLSVAQGEGPLQGGTEAGAFVQGEAQLEGLRYGSFGNFALHAETHSGLQGTSSIIHAGDFNSQVSAAAGNPNSEPLPATAAHPAQAKTILQLNLSDAGTTDGRPTYLHRIVLKNAGPAHPLDWPAGMGGVVLRCNEDTIPLQDVDIEAETLEIIPLEDSLQIPDGESRILSIAIYFQGQGITDKQNFRCYFDADDHDWESGPNGSRLATEQNYDIYSAVFPVEVTAQKVTFADPPSWVSTETPFAVHAQAEDANGNRDKDITGSLALKAFFPDTGNDSLLQTSQFEEGKVVFQDMQYTGNRPFRLIASPGGGLLADTSALITPGRDLQVLGESAFEGENLANWQNIQDWTISGIAPISGNSSLKHNLDETTGSSSLIRELPAGASHGRAISWHFQLKNGSWVPSSNNYFYYALLSDTAGFHPAHFSGYAVGLHKGDGADYIGIWQYDKGQSPKPVVATDVAWGSGQAHSIAVRYTPDGFWRLAVGPDAGALQTQGKAYAPVWGNPNYTGLFFAFGSASRAGLLWMDNWAVRSLNMPPALQAVKVLSSEDLVVQFSENIQIMPATAFILRKKTGENLLVERATFVEGQASKLRLETEAMQSGFYTLIVRHIADSTGLAAFTDTLGFAFALQPAPGDVVINELLPDPTPAVQLPESEFIEIFNNSAYDFETAGWAIAVNGNTKFLPADTLAPGGYRIICHATDSALWASYGPVWAVGGLPALTNTGGSVKLLQARGQTADSVAYANDWYGHGEKGDGGWSLERIDPDNTCGQRQNWQASEAPAGGTPGAENAVRAPNLDTGPPALVSLTVPGARQVLLTFSEALTDTALHHPGHVQLAGEGRQAAYLFFQDEEKTQLLAEFMKPLASATNYSLRLTGITDRCGNMMADTMVSFSYYEAGLFDVVFNELMPDPTPAVGLPETEYIELYNRSAYTIDLKDWVLKAGNTDEPLPAVRLEPGGYLVLADAGAQAPFPDSIPIAPLASMPALPNSSGELALYTPAGQLVDVLFYNDSWYNDDFKEDGGWALERLDTDNPREGAANWQATQDLTGGTPGRRNSVAAPNPDLTPPQAVQLGMPDPHHLHIRFSEALDTVHATKPVHYSANGGLGTPMRVWGKSLAQQEFVLEFAQPATSNTQYELDIAQAVQDYAGNPLATSGALAFAFPVSPQAGDILINEILFNPYPEGADFVELYNASDYPLDLGETYLAKIDENGDITDYATLAPQGTALFPGAYWVATPSPEAVLAHYPGPRTGQVQEVGLPAMPNDEGHIALILHNGQSLDAVHYTKDMHYPLLASTDGVSLERVHFSLPATDAATWHSAAASAGYATPAAQNSQFQAPENEAENFTIEPKIFSPDHDGKDDFAYIHYKLDEPGYVMNVAIYDANGRLVRNLVKNELLGTKGQFLWDGTNNNGQRVGMGIYVVYIEIFAADGKVKSYKKPCVVAWRL